ncbi:hypothetical protein M404DRAFT_1008882 [Pisolithus tinctorius Marx 270]|uniref:Uncharacterized protein n=1 Tax=Pisolithus tinctorius Marx 270 TaxID=870435 RepID=A0A0C3I8S5_PISTI|nr:hypothetical protein M404DRAFT_1008882 [Pisolithus tinctorius Marx 270]
MCITRCSSVIRARAVARGHKISGYVNADWIGIRDKMRLCTCNMHVRFADREEKSKEMCPMKVLRMV